MYTLIKKNKKKIRLLTIALFIFVISLAGGNSISNYPHLSIARDPTWYPLELLGKEKNLLAFSEDLLSIISKKTDLNLFTITSGPSSLIFELENKTSPAILSSLQPAPQYQDKFIFSDPYFLTGPVLVLTKDSPTLSLEEMSNKKVGVHKDSLVVYDLKTFPNISIQTFENIRAGLDDLEAGKINGFIMDLLPAYAYTEGLFKDKLKIILPPLTTDGIRLIATNDSTGKNLVEKFNKELKKIKKKSTYQTLLKKWGLFNP